MRWGSKISLRRKLMLVIMINTVAALCVASVAFAEYGVQRFKQVGMQDLNALANIIGTNCTAPLVFKDPNAAHEILQALSVKPHISAAAVYDLKGKPFATYKALAKGHDLPAVLSNETSRVEKNSVLIYQPIFFEGEKVGAVLLVGDRGEEQQLLLRYLYFFGLIIVVVSLGAYLTAGRLQSPISDPILELAWTTKMVTSSRDYSIRAGKRSQDEVGVLIDGFNEMLGEIQRRDTELRLAGEDLERRVNERTLELEQEVGDRQRAQEALRESEERIRLLLDSTAEAIFGTDQKGNCTFCNPATLRLLGYENADKLLGICIHDLIHHTRADGTHYPIEECVIRIALDADEGLHSDQEVFWRADGTSFPVELWAFPIRKAGEAVGAVITFLDITARKKGQAALMEAKEAAEAASRAKSEFLANMSHEIRTPMNGIIGMTELALDTTLSAEQRDYLNLVKSSADGLLHVINDILDFSKIEAGKLELEKTEFGIRDLFKNTLKTLAVRADKRGTEVTVRIAPEIPEAVVGDSTRLRQLLVNLVGNSIKFTEHGNIHVNAELEPGATNEIRLHISISDTGIGIAKEKQGLIFEAFSQADGSTTRRFGGTGLGLTISRQLVELMGGKIWLESEVGRGSTFHFTCAFEKGSEIASGEEDAGLIPTGLHVLIVDNNPTNHAILSEMLTNWRMAPSVASTGAAAFLALDQARAAGRPFSIVLLDAKMPADEGFKILERIHRNRGMADAVIMMVPLERQNTEIERCRELGANQIVSKPVSQSDLLDAILFVLGVNGVEENLAAPPRLPVGISGRPLNVLLAEDNIVNQKLAVRLLEKAGHRVTLAGSGREALTLWENQAPPGFDVVLMDIQMPEMDGMEATAAVREREKHSGKHTLILAMTAHAMRGDKERCLAAGMDGYVSKPIHPAALFAEIERCLEGREEAGKMMEQSALTDNETQLDHASLLERVEGDQELLVEMVRLFREDAPNLLAAINAALQRGDMASLEHSAHSFKGAASNLSAKAVAEAAAQLEKHAKNRDGAAAKAGFARLESALKSLIPALAELCEGVTG